jgi:type IV pilus assembly protein PilY1
MLHAFNGNTGAELWAYVPRVLMADMYRLADDNYAVKHRYFVDGSPQYMDVYAGGYWRTILVGGLNSGGRAYFALDITNPTAPKLLWEFCADSSLDCTETREDLGLSFAPPIITKRAYDKKWVVLVNSGYNNVAPGKGGGWLYVLDALTGEIIDEVPTKTGDESTPANLGRMNAAIEAFDLDNTSLAAYMGDMSGNIWKFDLTKANATAKRIGLALDDNGLPQPITSKPEIGLVDKQHVVIYVGTGRYLGARDLTDPQSQDPKGNWAWDQSLYAFKDLDKDLGDLRSGSNQLIEQKITPLNAAERTISNNKVDWTTDNGWYVDLNPGNTSPGERINVDMQLVLGTLVVAANVPSNGACSLGGDAWSYQFDYMTGSYISTAPNQVVGKKVPGALVVGAVVYQLPGGAIINQMQKSDTSTQKEGVNVNPNADNSRRTSWREIVIER